MLPLLLLLPAVGFVASSAYWLLAAGCLASLPARLPAQLAAAGCWLLVSRWLLVARCSLLFAAAWPWLQELLMLKGLPFPVQAGYRPAQFIMDCGPGAHN